MRRDEGRALAAVAWAGFQPRTAALAAAFAGRATFVVSRLRGHPALLPARYLACAARTWRALEDQRPERVLVVTPPVVAPLAAWLWCRLRRRPLVVDCHTGTFHSRRWSWAVPVHRWLLRRARAALLHTEEAFRLVEGWGARAVLLPDDLPGPGEAEVRTPAVRPTVLVAGSLDANEPVAEVLRAAALLPDLDVRVTGDPALIPAAAPPVPDNVVLTGFLPYPEFLGEMLAAHVVAVFSTDPHIMNRAAFEAIGLGRPLVLSDLDGLRSRFRAAARFAVNRPEAMAATIRDALRDRELLAARSESLAVELRAQRKRALALLREVLDGSPGPAGGARPAAAPSAPPRVLRVTQRPLGDPVVRRDVDELLRHGAEVDIICTASRPGVPEQPGPHHPGLRVFRVPLHHHRRPLVRYPLEYAAFFVAALAVASWQGRRRRYTAVQVDNLPDLLVFAAVVPRRRGARLVLNMFELMPEMAGARFSGPAGRALVRLCRRVERAATSWVDHVITVNRPCFDVLRARGVPANRMSVVLNTTPQTGLPAAPLPSDAPLPSREGSGEGDPSASPSSPNPLRPFGPPPPARGGGPGNSPVLVTHTTLVERYGVHVAVAAMAHLCREWPGLTLRVVGGGEQMGRLVRLVDELGLAGRVVFTGGLRWADTLDEVRRATLGIVAVVPDGYGQLLLPTKLLEYARLGVPAVCSRLSGIEAYFPPDALAYFRPGDHLALAEQVARLLRDPELARAQARRAEETARGLAWEHFRDDYLGALGVLDACPAR